MGSVVLKNLRKADDGVEWCSQFMTHARQEGVFGLVGCFGNFLCGAGQFNLALLGNVTEVKRNAAV